jgi:hypothetical protein
MKYFNQRRFTSISALLFFGLFVFAGSIFAVESNSIKIQPGIIEEKAEPGKDFSSSMTATNAGAISQTYTVTVKDIESIDEGGRPVFAKNANETTGFEMSSWVKVQNETFTLAPNESITVPFVVSVPKDATPGGHFGAIFITTGGQKPDANGAAVGYQVGTLLSFQVSGDVVENADIREFTSDKTLYGETKVKFTVKIENKGNSLIRPRGMIDVVDMFGKKTVSLKLNDSAAAVFPHSSRVFTTSWEDTKPHLGKYTAIASLSYGLDVKRSIFSEIQFYIAPMSIVTPVLGFLFLVALVLYISVKLYIRKKMKEYGINPKKERTINKADFSSRSTVMFLAFFIFSAVFILVLLAMLA